MGRTKKFGAIKERVSFSCSPDFKKRIDAVVGEMTERSYSAGLRKIIAEGLGHWERHYDLDDGQIPMFPDNDATKETM